jgi:iron complex outermembrane receptor protein
MNTCSRSVRLSLAALPLLLLLLFPKTALGQVGGVAGTVRDDATAAGLAAVLVEVMDASGAVVANGTSGPGGAFRINGVPAGTYTIRFTSPGWNTATLTGQTVTAGQLTSVSATMTEGSYSLNPITVTASRTEEKVLDAPAAVEVVSSLDIQERPSVTTIDHVKSKAGVDVIQTGVQTSYVVVRGFNNIFSGASLTLTDNRISRVPSLRANISHLTPTTNLDLDKVEVVLGPGSALYGPNAANGVIHSLTRSPIDHPGVSFSVAGGLRQQSSEDDPSQVAGGLPFSGSDEGLFHGEGRIAIAPSEQFGMKVSGQYFKGTEYTFIDTEEAGEREDALSCIQSGFNLNNPDCLAFSEGLDLTDPADQALLQTSVNNVCRPNSGGTSCQGRDNNLERWTLDGRIDWRPTPETSVILSGGRTTAISSVDLTGLGAAQVIDWAYNYAQARINHRDLFAQFFWNKSDNDKTYLLRSGRPLIDKSQIFVGQLQHAARLGETHRFIYGADLIRTTPDTEGTINGKNDDDDNVTEIGGYLQWEWALDPKLDFVAAARLDDHSRLEDPVFSPRAALVYKPDPGSSIRATFNRAFSTPTTLNLFLDISGERLPLGGPFRYDIRATGSTEVGHQFMRDANGIPMHMSPFNVLLGGSPRQFLPTTTAQLWQEAVALVAAQDAQAGALLGLIAPPGESDIGIVALTLDPSLQLGAPATGDCPAPPFCVTPGGLAGIQDFDRLKPTITNTFEVGYKGLLGGRVLLGINGWWSHITDFTSALRIASPNVFLNGQDIGVYLTTQFLPLVGIAFPDAATAQATAASLASTIGRVPLGVVTPQSVGGTDATLAFVYENLGSLDVFGAEVVANFLLSDEWELATTLSIVDKDEFETSARGVEELVPLNAPTVKSTAALSYRSEGGFNSQVRFRYQNGFEANSAVYIGHVDAFAVVDVGLGYKLPGLEGVWLQLDVQNVFDNHYQTFVGAPVLGRFGMARIRYDFSPF